MILKGIQEAVASGKKLLAILVDPDKFNTAGTADFFDKIPPTTSHILVGGSTVEAGLTEKVVRAIKAYTKLPVVLFPGGYHQISQEADGILFLSLISGRNPEYLIGQQLKSVPYLRNSDLEIIPTGYLLIDGGRETAVQRVTGTEPFPQDDMEGIVDTSLAGEYMGKKLIYLEAGSAARYPVSPRVISEVKKAIGVPLIVGGGIKTGQQLQEAFIAGADMVVMGTAFE